MNILSEVINLFKSGLTNDNYYRVFNHVYKQCFGEYYMLHYPLYRNDGDDLFQCQKNLTDYCLSLLPNLKDKKVLEVGCGNGVQAIYICKDYAPAQMIGIDLNEENIKIANMEKQRQNLQNIQFLISDAQDIKPIESNSIDIVINIESAMHYPGKKKFIGEIFRVLKPGGSFIIADILTKIHKDKKKGFWKKKMAYYHWPLDRYIDALPKSGLELHTSNDITQDVLKGYKTCSIWIKNYRDTRVRNHMRIWGNLMITLNAYLLKRKRTYHVFTGIKPANAS